MRRQRRKYIKPGHPWEKERMDWEDKLLSQFGLKRKREIWRAQTILRSVRRQARRLLSESGQQAEREKKLLISRLHKLGLVEENATLDDALGLTVDKILERYLQTVVYRKGLAKSPLQARQMIVHQKIMIGDRKVNVPSYIVPTREEQLIHVAQMPEKLAEGQERGGENA